MGGMDGMRRRVGQIGWNGWKRWVVKMGGIDREGDDRMEGWRGGCPGWVGFEDG